MHEKDRNKQNKKEVENENRRIIDKLVPIIRELEKKGIKHNQSYDEGVGDVIEGVLNKLGVTEERFKSLFNLKECGCQGRKKWLNSVLHWHREKK